MALLWADGFDQYGSVPDLLANHYVGQWSLTQANPRTGGWSAQLNPGGACDFNFAEANLAIIGFAYRQSAYGDLRIQVRSPAQGEACTIQINANGSIDLHQGNEAGPILASSAAGVSNLNVYNYMEVFWGTAGIAGNPIRIHVNNVEVINTAGINGTNTVQFRFVQNTGGLFLLDDLYMVDTTGPQNNTFLGDIRCRTLFPTGNGGLQGWAANGNPNAWQSLGEVPPNLGVDFIASGAAGDVSNFPIAPVPINTATVFGLFAHIIASKSDAGGCQITPQLSSNGAVADGTVINPAQGEGYFQAKWDVDPDGGGPWTRTKVNAALAQVTRTL